MLEWERELYCLRDVTDDILVSKELLQKSLFLSYEYIGILYTTNGQFTRSQLEQLLFDPDTGPRAQWINHKHLRDSAACLSSVLSSRLVVQIMISLAPNHTSFFLSRSIFLFSLDPWPILRQFLV